MHMACALLLYVFLWFSDSVSGGRNVYFEKISVFKAGASPE